jgi:hypothetical protein
VLSEVVTSCGEEDEEGEAVGRKVERSVNVMAMARQRMINKRTLY